MSTVLRLFSKRGCVFIQSILLKGSPSRHFERRKRSAYLIVTCDVTVCLKVIAIELNGAQRDTVVHDKTCSRLHNIRGFMFQFTTMNDYIQFRQSRHIYSSARQTSLWAVDSEATQERRQATGLVSLESVCTWQPAESKTKYLAAAYLHKSGGTDRTDGKTGAQAPARQRIPVILAMVNQKS